MTSPNGKPAVYRFGVFEANTVTGELLKKGVRAKLQEQPFRLLCLLLEKSGSIVTKEEVRDRLWPGNTFVEFDASLSVAVGKLRDALGDDSDNPRFIETVPRKGYRFIAPVQTVGELAVPLPSNGEDPISKSTAENGTQSPRILILVCVVALILTAGVVGRYLHGTNEGKLAEKASVVVGDFANTTGDAVFDGSLQRATITYLAQSPYLSVLPDTTIADTLQDLGRPPNEKLTPAMLRQVCQRQTAAAAVDGSIQKSSDQYLLSVEAVRCADGSTLAIESIRASSKENVLPSLDTAIQNLRRKLGESRESLQKYDAELQQGTTSSLEAMKAYQLGLELRKQGKNANARPAFETAIQLDPHFAIAYAQLGSSYSNVGDEAEAVVYFKKAYELRAKATEPERIYIVGRYYDIVTGETEKAAEVYKLGTEMYPKDWVSFNAVANDANQMGRYDTAIQASQRVIALAPNHSFGYINLLLGLVASNRFEEAMAIDARLKEKQLDDSTSHTIMYAVAYSQGDQSGLQRERDWAAAHSNDRGIAFMEAQRAAALGKLREANERFRLVAQRAIADNDPGSAADAMDAAAEFNSEIGNARIALADADASLKLEQSPTILARVALVNARSGRPSRAEEILAKLDHDVPLNVFNLNVYSPMTRTVLAALKKTTSAQVYTLMEPALPYEFGQNSLLLPIYVRAECLLKTGDGEGSAREFQKLLDHHGVDPVSPLISLSYLGLGRAYKLTGKLDESVQAYNKFFALWRDADPDLPILIEARREFPKPRSTSSSSAN